ncbi:hypothetical protein JMJ99_05300 [Companilactobacillus zhachilii]|uniref:hypothetical protein n=1 Tax=Companilactobacillus zhachilii TaxID=2304606 RepID=UPI001922CEE0|nr:hypothetical protein [Companilactobacillus zhachilii]MBL3530779.1 hypothetical protein [Companilactobacillus zhachilii]
MEKEDKLDKELQNLIDKIEWNLNSIKEDADVFDVDNDREVSNSDIAIDISNEALRLSELLKMYDKSVQYDPEMDK